MTSHATIDVVRRPLFRTGRRRHPGTTNPLAVPLVVPIALFAALVGAFAALIGRVRPALLPYVLLGLLIVVAAALVHLADPTVLPAFVDPANLPRPTPYPGGWTYATP